MVFDVGDCVTGWGRMIADADGEWLDLARAMTLEWSDRPRPRSHHSVRLIGADFDAVPTEFGPNNAIPGTATISGIWLGRRSRSSLSRLLGHRITPLPSGRRHRAHHLSATGRTASQTTTSTSTSVISRPAGKPLLS